MSIRTASFAVSWVSEQSTGTRALRQEQQLNRFLADVERRALRIAVMVWIGRRAGDDNDYDAVAAAADPIGRTPAEELQNSEAMESLENAIHELPQRQREAFMLRTFEGLDVAGTAVAMGCSEGSVKTHYSRAIHSLREQLGEYGPDGSGDQRR
jgi:RNA polymerase sigma-70 factor (ECF subfamily)